MESLAELRKALREARKEEVRPVSKMKKDEIKAELAKYKAKDEDSDSEHDMPAGLPRRAVSKDLTVGLIKEMGAISINERSIIEASGLPDAYKNKLLQVQIVKVKPSSNSKILADLRNVIVKLHLATNTEDVKEILTNYFGEPATVAPHIPKKPKSRSPSPKMETKAVTNPLSIKYAPRKK